MPLEDLDPRSPAHWPQVQLFVAVAGAAPARVQMIRTPWGLRLCFFASSTGANLLALDLSTSETETLSTALRSLASWVPAP